MNLAPKKDLSNHITNNILMKYIMKQSNQGL